MSVHKTLSRRAALATLASAPLATGLAQTPPPPPRGQGIPRDLTKLIPPLTESGFEPIFDGKSMDGWDGDHKFWRIEEGALVGQTTTENQPAQNTFLIWRKGKPANFELKTEYKLTGFNSGIQYRSIELPDIKWAMKGYQADIDGEQMFTGQIYEERGRGFLALRGESTYIASGQKPGVVGTLGTSDELKALIKGGNWNDLHIIARGNVLIQYINGRMMSMLVDDDEAGRKMDGLLGIQVHKGPAMKIEVRNIRIRNL